MKHRHPTTGSTWEDAYLVGIHRYSYRAGEPAKIIGMIMHTPFQTVYKDEISILRPCYHIIFPDGVEEYIPVADFLNFAIISETDVEKNKIPPISQ